MTSSVDRSLGSTSTFDELQNAPPLHESDEIDKDVPVLFVRPMSSVPALVRVELKPFGQSSGRAEYELDVEGIWNRFFRELAAAARTANATNGRIDHLPRGAANVLSTRVVRRALADAGIDIDISCMLRVFNRPIEVMAGAIAVGACLCFVRELRGGSWIEQSFDAALSSSLESLAEIMLWDGAREEDIRKIRRMAEKAAKRAGRPQVTHRRPGVTADVMRLFRRFEQRLAFYTASSERSGDSTYGLKHRVAKELLRERGKIVDANAVKSLLRNVDRGSKAAEATAKRPRGFLLG